MPQSDILIPGYERVVCQRGPASSLDAIVAIHSTALGPAIGGVRLYPYASELDALSDALRLAKAMSYKTATAALNLGGGKAIIIGDPRHKTPDLLRAFGRLVESLGGRYITAEDVGTTTDDMDMIAQQTSHVVGRSGVGDPSPLTALGVFRAHRVVAAALTGSRALAGVHVVVQGVGRVGSQLCRLLAQAGARLTVADLDDTAVRRATGEFGASAVAPASAHATPCDIFAPCALGPVVTDQTLPELRCRAIAGAANNVLAQPSHGAALQWAGILFAPDYVINAGGLIHVAAELDGYSGERVRARVDHIEDTLALVFRVARSRGISPGEAADRLAEERITNGHGPPAPITAGSGPGGRSRHPQPDA